MSAPEHLILILFKVLIGFIALNVIVNFILLYTRRLKIYKLLAIYWPIVLLMYLFIGKFQTGQLEIILSYGISAFIICSIGALIGLEVVGRKLPLRNYSILFAVTLPLTLILHSMNLGFTIVAMPFAIATATPVLHAFLHLVFLNKTTRLQKVLGIVFFLEAVHCINFALFRMDPDAQLWGWFVTYVLLDLFAILLPSIALEKASMNEKERLQELVSERTLKLNRSLQTNKSLFKVLIHDISNPLMSIKSYLYLLDKDGTDAKMILEKLSRSQMALEEIIAKMKSVYFLENKSQIPLSSVPLTDCLMDIKFILEETLKQKSITLEIDQPDPKLTVLADQTSLTHSVLGNILSNAIKFNSPNSKIHIHVKRQDGKVIIDIEDEGPGISDEIITEVFRNKEILSTDGTAGEQGSGLGLSIIKSFIDYYDGQLEFISHQKKNESGTYGTTVRIILHEANE